MVLIARPGQCDQVLSVIPIAARYAGVIPNVRDPDQTPVVPMWYYADVVSGCGRQPERPRPERRTYRSSRPLRARDRSVFDSFCSALAAAELHR